jgi:hypothetical protein
LVIVLDKNGFKLPRVDREKFLLLLKLGLDYNQREGLFCFKNYNNIDKVTEIVVAILKSEVVFLQSCMVCGKSFGCDKCKYNPKCETRNMPLSCVCPKCLSNQTGYREKVAII